MSAAPKSMLVYIKTNNDILNTFKILIWQLSKILSGSSAKIGILTTWCFFIKTSDFEIYRKQCLVFSKHHLTAKYLFCHSERKIMKFLCNGINGLSTCFSKTRVVSVLYFKLLYILLYILF